MTPMSDGHWIVLVALMSATGAPERPSHAVSHRSAEGADLQPSSASAPYLQPVYRFIDLLRRGQRARLPELCHLASSARESAGRVGPELEGIVATGGGGTKLKHVESGLLAGVAQISNVITDESRGKATTYRIELMIRPGTAGIRPLRYRFLVMLDPPKRAPGWYIVKIVQPCF